MTTLQKLKHFAIQCGASQSPTRSQVVHLRHRKTTLRMLLSRRQRECLLEKKKKRGDQVRRHSLKDLFLSSPQGDETKENEDTHSISNSGFLGSGYVPGSPKPAWTGFRYRALLSKKAWRPILLTVAE